MSVARALSRAGCLVAPALLFAALSGASVAQPGAKWPNPLRGMAQGQSVALEGRVQVLVEEHPGGRTVTRHFLQTGRGRVELQSSDRQLDVDGGNRIRVQGQVNGEMLTLSPSPSSVQVTAAAVLPAALGEQRVAVILVNFQDDTSKPISRDAAHTLVFTTVNNFYRKSSFDQTWLAGTTFDWVTVPFSKGTCIDGMQIAAEADKAVAAAGGNLTGYNRKVYMFPKNACSWTGLALVNENPSMAWINGAFTLKSVGHELGHNLGLRHAHALDCDASPTGNACTTLPYGDAADLMGNVRTGDFSPYAKERLGWLNDGVSPPILTADRSGRYTIEPYASASVGAKAIRVPRGVDANGKPLWFYLEHRLPVGVDTALDGVGNLAQGVMVRTVVEGDGDSIHQIDMTPNSVSGSTADLSDGALTVGRSYTDPLTGHSITVASVSATGAVVDVSFAGTPVAPAPAPVPTPVCSGATPMMAQAASSTTGNPLNYVITLHNASGGCAAKAFSVAASMPLAWAGVQVGAGPRLGPWAAGGNMLEIIGTMRGSAPGSHRQRMGQLRANMLAASATLAE